MSHLDYCSVMCSGATKRDLGKLQLAQNRAAWLALGCTRRANINNMHVDLAWHKVEERLTSSLLVFVRSVDKLNAPRCLLKPQHTARTPMHTPQDMEPEVCSQSRSPEQTMGGSRYNMTSWNSIPHQVTDASS